MTLNIPSKSFGFDFTAVVVGAFDIDIDCNQEDPFLKELFVSYAGLTTIAEVRPQELWAEPLKGEYPALYSSSLGTAKCVPYEIDLSDTTPVRSPPIAVLPRNYKSLSKWLTSFWNKGLLDLLNHHMPVQLF